LKRLKRLSRNTKLDKAGAPRPPGSSNPAAARRLATARPRRHVALWLVTTRPSAGTLYVAVIALAGLTGISAAASLVAIPELLPRLVRATGLSIYYALFIHFPRHDPVLIILPDRREQRP